ncbi:UNVERIFIED_CONTAM: hypothetical protein GTU68_052042 [Idotea baltica]|nr:hypothetical protein [Idotea baltica]
MTVIAPSILAANWGTLREEIVAAEEAGADWFHLDVMDGQFVPPITFGEKIVATARAVTKLPLDVHLMINNPERQLEAIAAAGADRITVHVETCPHLHRTLDEIKKLGCKAGVALNPATSLETIRPILGDLDLLLVMTINPGWGGQALIPETLVKLRTAKALLDGVGSSAYLQVDGGVNSKTVSEIKKAGANSLVAGTAIFGSDDYKTAISSLRSA